MSRLHRLLLDVAARDTRAVRAVDGGWVVPCLHCQSKLALSSSGAPLGPATLEHIVPRSWFGKAAARDLVRRVGEAEADANLAIACARCNQQKGKTHDADGPSNPRAREVVAALLDTRAERLGTPRAELVSGDSPPV
jgi:5-methylcytosine-specific restriction endonuclease McrA